MGPPWLCLKKNYQNRVSQSQNTTLRLILTNTEFCKRTMYATNMLRKIYKRVLDIISYPESTMGPPWLGLGKNFQNEGSQESSILRSVFGNAVNASFNYKLFQLMYKHYVAFNS